MKVSFVLPKWWNAQSCTVKFGWLLAFERIRQDVIKMLITPNSTWGKIWDICRSDLSRFNLWCKVNLTTPHKGKSLLLIQFSPTFNQRRAFQFPVQEKNFNNTRLCWINNKLNLLPANVFSSPHCLDSLRDPSYKIYFLSPSHIASLLHSEKCYLIHFRSHSCHCVVVSELGLESSTNSSLAAPLAFDFRKEGHPIMKKLCCLSKS